MTVEVGGAAKLGSYSCPTSNKVWSVPAWELKQFESALNVSVVKKNMISVKNPNPNIFFHPKLRSSNLRKSVTDSELTALCIELLLN